MADDTWADYLEAASEHLRAARRAVEQGAASPDPPRHPAGTLPDELQPEVRRLALAYDQLALEVATRMADMQCHLTPPRVEAQSLPHYVDQMA
jgi:hypothetical protein